MTDTSPDAFPHGEGPYVGMSLMDYFAGQALAGLVSYDRQTSISTLARFAYDLAEAMCDERLNR
jgi:hypothetical protein